MTETRTTCCYCGTGCGVVAESDGTRIVNVRGDESHPSSRGKLCTKGSTLHLTMTPAAQASRARYPEMRHARTAPRRRVTWDEALDHVADRFAAIIAKHGPDAVAFYVSGQLLTEDYYVFNKLAKGLIGTANIDTNSRLCMSSAVSGYTKTLGADAPPSCYDDIEAAGCLFIAGSNTAFAHPVLYRRIEAARERNPELRVIVVDPRRTQTAEAADLHLPILPGTDVALFHGMLHAMLWEGLVDHDWIAATRKSQAVWLNECQSVERVAALFERGVFVSGQRQIRAPGIRAAFRHHHQSIRFLERQWPQQHSIHDTEDRGIGADAERKRDDGDRGEPRPLQQPSHAIANVFND